MNKKILLLGSVAVAAYFTLTGFGPKQDAQKAEIAQMVTTKLNDLRAQKDQECTDRVTAEAKTRYDAFVAATPAPAPTAAPKKMVKKGSKGPKVDPLPQPSKPATDPQKTRGGAVQEGNAEQQKTRGGAVQESAPQTPAQQKKRGGAAKVEGGGGN